MAQEELVKHVPVFARSLPILLVDNDEASLTSLASTLENFSYKVTSTTSRTLALSIIRQQNGEFKLVMANVNIFNRESLIFVRQIVKEHIPIVVIMSNNNMDFAAKALAEGASFCLERPLTLKDLKNIWQHACRHNITNIIHVVEEEIDISPETNNNIDQQHHTVIVENVVGMENNSHSILSSHCQSQFGSNKRKSIDQNDHKAAAKKHKVDDDFNVESNDLPQGFVLTRTENEHGARSNSSSKRRSRVVWTAELHLKFTAALSALGDTRARPKSILQKMNVPYLTQRQVASHLQKYKAQVQRISEIAEADTSCFTIRGYGSDTSDDAYHSVETVIDPWSKRCETNFTNIGDINNFVCDPNFSHMPNLPLHDPSNVEHPTFGDQSYNHVVGLDSFKEDFDLPNAISVAALQSNGEISLTSVGATSTNSIFDIPTSEPIIEMEAPTYLVNHSFTEKTDLCKMSEEVFPISQGFCGEQNIDDSNQYMEWLVDVLGENN